MFKTSFLNVLLYIFIRYIVFYIFLMLKNNDFNLLKWKNITDGSSLTYFLLVMSIPIILSMLLFSAPIYYSFKTNRRIWFTLIISIVFAGEYFIYVWGTSQKYFQDMNGVYNLIIGLIVFALFFYKPIIAIFKSKINTKY